MTIGWGEQPQETRDGARAYVVVPVVSPKALSGAQSGLSHTRSPQSRAQEAVSLAGAIDLDIQGHEIITLNKIRPATLFGGGKIEEIASFVKEHEVELVFVDAALSPVQQRNLEKEIGAKVIDRTGLILEIFGRRARTKEGSLQVELAHLTFQKSRLVRSWTHLERQRGGFGFLGGPGETQIEADRRLLQDRMTRIERELEQVKRTRRLHRAGRKRIPFPIVALVGYTNAGKSTLFNHLTQSTVFAKDLLFATLDPTLRQVKLASGRKVILSDTVGFISDLPTLLVAAFRATLEEVLEADLILHVRDIASPETEDQSRDVAHVLNELGIKPDDPRLIEVWNKVDLLADEPREHLKNMNALQLNPAVLVSAVTGQGTDQLLARIEETLGKALLSVELLILPADMGLIEHWLHENATISSRDTDESGETHCVVRIAPDKVGLLERRLRTSAGSHIILPS